MTSERVNRAEVVLPFLVLHVHCALICEEHGVAAVTCRHDTIEHVHSALYRLQDILWCAYSHQIAWLVFRQYIVDHLYHLVHNLCRLPHSESANGIAVSSFVGDVFGRLPSEVWILASLHDREEGLLVAIEGFCLAEAPYAAVEPSVGHLHRLLRVLVVCLAWGTLVECHHYVRSYDTLCVHDVLRREDVP